MSARIELEKLLDLALGTPEIGAVNFNALHGVLAEVIKTLGVGSKLVDYQNNAGSGPSYGKFNLQESLEKTSKGKTATSAGHRNGIDLETKVANLENKLKALDELPSNAEIVKRVREKDTRMAVGDMWQSINMNRRLSATETAIEKVATCVGNVANR